MTVPIGATPPASTQMLIAAGYMVLASALFASMHGTVRLISFELHPFVIAFFRNLLGFLVLVPLLMRGGSALFKTARFGTHAIRATINAGSMLMWFTALSLVPLAEATALSLTGPLFVMLGAIVAFGERIRAWRWAALGLGACGALLIIRPGFEAIHVGMLLTVGSAATAGVSKLFAKSLTRTDSPTTIAAYLQFLMTPITLVPALFVWVWPTAEQFLGLIAIGVLGSLGHLFSVKAYAIADISFAEPIVFTRMIWATLFGFIAFSEVPDAWTWAGAATIIVATTVIAQRERLARRAARAAAVPAE
jgi:drug/metabolite transporter (DMT)-like permease